MAYVAQSRLVHGYEDSKGKAQRVVYEDGDELDTTQFSKQQLKALVDSGAVEQTNAPKEAPKDDGSSEQGQGSQTPPAS